MAPQTPTVTSVTPLPLESAKWVTLNAIHWLDPQGTPRVWEAAARKTRGAAGVDAVVISPILRYPRAHPPRAPDTVLVVQFRPPVGRRTVEFPAGLVDAGEQVAAAALRELREETGLAGGRVVDVGPVVAADPGLAAANMQVAAVDVDVDLAPGAEPVLPDQKLDEGEFVERFVVPLLSLHERLLEFDAQGLVVDSRLWHWAAGFRLAKAMA